MRKTKEIEKEDKVEEIPMSRYIYIYIYETIR